MSVLARFRKESKLEFYNNALKVRREVIQLMKRDFGMKPRTCDIRVIAENMAPADREDVYRITGKYGGAKVEYTYPEWLIEHLRENLWKLNSEMIINVTRAYTIWPTCKMEVQERRISQDRAVANCESMLQELAFTLDILPMDAEKYIPLLELIDKEISLLKGWRKSDNKRFKDFK